MDEHECALAMERLLKRKCRAEEVENGGGGGGGGGGSSSSKKQEREREMMEEMEKKDQALVAAFSEKYKRALGGEEAAKLSKLEQPEPFEGELLEEDVNQYRIFSDFTVFVDKDYEGSYQEAGKIFKEMGRSDGFEAMFSYRFS